MPPKKENKEKTIDGKLVQRLLDDLERVEALIHPPEAKLILNPLKRLNKASDMITEAVRELYELFGVPLSVQWETTETPPS